MTSSILTLAFIPFWLVAPAADKQTAGEQLMAEAQFLYDEGHEVIDIRKSESSMTFTFGHLSHDDRLATELTVHAAASGQLKDFRKAKVYLPAKWRTFHNSERIVRALTSKAPTHFDVLARDADVKGALKNGFGVVLRAESGARAGVFAARWLGGHMQDGGYVTSLFEELSDDGAEVTKRITFGLHMGEGETIAIRLTTDSKGQLQLAELIEGSRAPYTDLEWIQRIKDGDKLIVGKRINSLSVNIKDADETEYGLFEAAVEFGMPDGSVIKWSLVEEMQGGC